MFDCLVEVSVLNAKKVISEALIGSFEFDLGLVYDEVEHCFIHKWLLLTDLEDPSGEAKVHTRHMCTYNFQPLYNIYIVGVSKD